YGFFSKSHLSPWSEPSDPGAAGRAAECEPPECQQVGEWSQFSGDGHHFEAVRSLCGFSGYPPSRGRGAGGSGGHRRVRSLHEPLQLEDISSHWRYHSGRGSDAYPIGFWGAEGTLRRCVAADYY